MPPASDPTPALHTPAGEITTRIGRLQQQIFRQGWDGALILQSADLFYYTGTIQQGHLYVPAEGEALLMVRKSYERARSESPLTHVLPLSGPKALPDLLRESGLPLPGRLGMELDVVPANLFFSYQQIFPAATIGDLSPLIRLQRAVKSPHEIGLMEKAAALADRVAAGIPELLREGISEIELAGLVESLARSLGHQGLVRMRLWGSELFYGHLMAGPSASVPSFLQSPTGGTGLSPAVAQGAGRRPIRRHEPVLVDYVFVHDGYMADHTRIFSLGALSRELIDGHQAMLDLQATLQAAARPGVTGGDLYELALARATAIGYGDCFMGAAEPRIRFVGHGLGLELDEYPFIARGQRLPLVEGMTLALEPKLVFPGQGVVGIENTHVVTADGLRSLTRYAQEIAVL